MITVKVVIMLENTYKILKSVEDTHKNLGIPVVWSKLIDLANLGTFIVAERGRGKGSILTALEQLRHRDVIKINILTYKGLKKLEQRLSDSETTLINRDLSTLYTDYLKDVGLNVIANLITDHAVKAETGQYSLDIRNAYISYIGGTQPQLLVRLTKLQGWESMYKDRFIRYYVLYLDEVEKKSPLPPSVPAVEFTNMNSVSFETSLRNEREYKLLLKAIMEQTSENRAPLYLENLIRASASLNGRTITTKEDLRLLRALLMNIKLDTLLSRRDYSVSEPAVFDAGAYLVLFEIMQRGEVSRRWLREYFRVSHQTIVRDMEILMKNGIVKGTYGADRYTVNPKFHDLMVKPQLQLLSEAGVYARA